MKSSLLIFLCFFITSLAIAQDIIYTSDGNKEEGKVLSVGPREIRFKKSSNPDGPEYIVEKRNVVLIAYANGTHDTFSTGGSRGGGNDSLSSGYGKNIILHNTFDLIQTNFTISYERIFADGLLGIRVPLTLGFNGINGASNYNAANFGQGTISAAGLDVYLYPDKQGKVRYLLGPSFLYTSYYYYDYYYDYSGYYGTSSSELRTGYQYAWVLKHGVQFQITPHFNMSTVLGLGLRKNFGGEAGDLRTRATLEINMGYRF